MQHSRASTPSYFSFIQIHQPSNQMIHYFLNDQSIWSGIQMKEIIKMDVPKTECPHEAQTEAFGAVRIRFYNWCVRQVRSAKTLEKVFAVQQTDVSSYPW